jgi:tetratricopeptide (TPR) repeat protein
MILLLLCGLAMAETPVDVGIGDVPTAAPVVEPATGDELVTEAWRRVEIGDFEGSRIVAQQAIDRDPAAWGRATAAIGASWELAGDPGRAIPVYDSVLMRDPTGPLADHMRLRLAECYGALGDTDAAFARLATLGDPADRAPDDALKIRLLTGIWQLDSGDRKHGLKTLGAALGGAPAGHVTFYQAKARAAIARSLCAQSNELGLVGSQKKQVKLLKQRTDLILAAERQVEASAELEEPEWVMEGLLVLGEAYEHVGDDLIGLPPPPELAANDEAIGIWNETVKKKADVLYTKASVYYDQGIEVSTRLTWTSPRLAKLEAAKAAVETKVAPGG